MPHVIFCVLSGAGVGFRDLEASTSRALFCPPIVLQFTLSTLLRVPVMACKFTINVFESKYLHDIGSNSLFDSFLDIPLSQMMRAFLCAALFTVAVATVNETCAFSPAVFTSTSCGLSAPGDGALRPRLVSAWGLLQAVLVVQASSLAPMPQSSSLAL